MKEDQARWNKRFSERPMVQAKAPAFIEEALDQLLPGSVLDIASGDGAAALFLAAKGFTVSAADISEDALDRLNTFAQEKNLEVSTYTLDLDHPEQLNELETFDNIVMTHFKPAPHYWPLLIALLRPGGKLLLSTFNLTHHEKNGFSRRFCLEPGELRNINEHLELEHFASIQRGESYMDDYLFRKV